MSSDYLHALSPAADPDKSVEHDAERAPPGALLLEIAWEVCNQIGGIYQVIRSKSKRMVGRWRNRYVLIGPWEPAKAALEFEERPATGWLAEVVESLAAQGVRAHCGRWLISGRPKVLLLEHWQGRDHLNAVKHRIFQDHGISLPWREDWLLDGVVSFSDAVRKAVLAACDAWVDAGAGPDDDGAPSAPPPAAGDGRQPAGAEAAHERRIIAHFHEWMTGLAIPMLRREFAPAAMVFTTHATLLGRYIASGDDNFYDHLPGVDHAAAARHFNVEAMHSIERASAHGAHVATTVSAITGEECSHLLGRRPDLVLPNGLNIDRYNVGHDFQTFHAQFKQRIHRFVMGHFFPAYSFDLDRTLYFFTSGRFEPRNKGFDVCIEAMARLNAMLKANPVGEATPEHPGGVTAILFIISQRGTRSIHPQELHARGVLRELREVCESITASIGEQFFRRAAAGERVDLDALVSEYWRLRFRRTQHALHTGRNPLLCTHILDDEANDPVLNHMRSVWFSNRREDPVKVVYHPEFISPVNPLWGIEYDQFVRGCHLGVFPSAYEPWGYTPLECIAMGVPAVTSDLAGFGGFVSEMLPDHDQWGLRILRRRGRSYGEASDELAHILYDFCRLDRRERIQMRNEVERRSWEFDWSRLGRAYDWAHDLAMIRAGVGVVSS